MPLPSEETTPPVTKMYLAICSRPCRRHAGFEQPPKPVPDPRACPRPAIRSRFPPPGSGTRFPARATAPAARPAPAGLPAARSRPAGNPAGRRTGRCACSAHARSPSRTIRDHRAGEVDRVAGPVGDHLDHVRVGQSSSRILDALLERAHRDLGVVEQGQHRRVDRLRLDQRLVALDVDHQLGGVRRRPPRPRGRCPKDGRRASCATGAPKRRASLSDSLVVGGDDDLGQVARLAGALKHVLQHGFAGNRGERFPGKAGGSKPGRNDPQNPTGHSRL